MSRFTVNGQPVHYRMDPATPLLWALRDASNLTGTKYGCGTGHCGACTVHVDGRAVRSCTVTLAELEGTFVTTIEGLSRDRSHAVQQAFAAQGAVQCGYCTPGMIMAAAALIARSPNPSEREMDAALANLCRCGVYPRLREAVRLAARIAAGSEEVAAAPPPGIDPEDAVREVPALRDVRPPRRGAPVRD
jgi:isoquinoline 1-oxidoreductase subunit alpha